MITGILGAKDENLDAIGAVSKIKRNLPQKVQGYCVNVLGNVSEVAKEIYGNEENPVAKLVKSETARVKAGQISRVHFTEQLKNLQGDMSEKQWEHLLDASMNLPEGFSEIDKMINGRKAPNSNYELMDKLLRGALQEQMAFL